MQLSVTSCQPHKLQDKLSTTTAGRTILAKFGRCTYLPMGEIPWVAATLHSQTRWKQLTPLPADALEIRLLPFYLWEQRRMMCLTCSLLIFLTVCNRPFNRMLLAILGVCLYHLFNFSKERLGSSPPQLKILIILLVVRVDTFASKTIDVFVSAFANLCRKFQKVLTTSSLKSNPMDSGGLWHPSCINQRQHIHRCMYVCMYEKRRGEERREEERREKVHICTRTRQGCVGPPAISGLFPSRRPFGRHGGIVCPPAEQELHEGSPLDTSSRH